MSVTSSALSPLSVCVLRVTLEKLVGRGRQKRPPSSQYATRFLAKFFWMGEETWLVTDSEFVPHKNTCVGTPPLSCLESHQGSFFPFFLVRLAIQDFEPFRNPLPRKNLALYPFWSRWSEETSFWDHLPGFFEGNCGRFKYFYFFCLDSPPKKIIPTCLSPPKKSQKRRTVCHRGELPYFFEHLMIYGPGKVRETQVSITEKMGSTTTCHCPGNFCCRHKIWPLLPLPAERRKQRCEKNYRKMPFIFLGGESRLCAHHGHILPYLYNSEWEGEGC